MSHTWGPWEPYWWKEIKTRGKQLNWTFLGAIQCPLSPIVPVLVFKHAVIQFNWLVKSKHSSLTAQATAQVFTVFTRTTTCSRNIQTISKDAQTIVKKWFTWHCLFSIISTVEETHKLWRHSIAPVAATTAHYWPSRFHLTPHQWVPALSLSS